MWKHLEKRPLTRLGKMMAMIVVVVMMMVKMILAIRYMYLFREAVKNYLADFVR